MSFFDNAYIGVPPWDIGRAQGAFQKIANNSQKYNLKDPLLDIGCGTGENSLFFAEKLGFSCTGIDTSPRAISKAIEKAKKRNLTGNTSFLNYNLFELNSFSKKFNTIIDCGVFHMFDAESRKEYEHSIKSVLNEKGRLIILAFSYLEPSGVGPSQRLTEKDYNAVFKDGWKIIAFEHEKFETNVGKNESKALLTIIEKE